LTAYFRTRKGSAKTSVEDIVSLNAVESANALNLRYILTNTQGKGSPCLISRFKPDGWILSCGGDEKTNNFLALSYGVHPLFFDNERKPFVDTDKAMRFLTKAGMLEKDERVILVEDETTSGMHDTDSLKIISVR
jgi:pyruvate kinase